MDSHLEVARWYAVYCRSKQERVVGERLLAKGIHTYVADYETRVQWGKRLRKTKKNLLPGYALIYTCIDPRTYLEILQTNSVVKFVGHAWPHLSSIPDEEVESLQILLGSRQPIDDVPYWHKGAPVEVVSGPLAGLVGSVTNGTDGKRRVIVSIELLKRSVSVEVNSSYLQFLRAKRQFVIRQ